MTAMRQNLTETARGLLDGSPDVSGGEYTRGMVEIITYATLEAGEDPDVVKEEIFESLSDLILENDTALDEQARLDLEHPHDYGYYEEN